MAVPLSAYVIPSLAVSASKVIPPAESRLIALEAVPSDTMSKSPSALE